MPSTQTMPISSTRSVHNSKKRTAASADHQRAAALRSGFDELCAVLKLTLPDVSLVGRLMFERLRFKAGSRVYVAGERFDRLYLVVSGFIKNILVDECGTEHVLGFPMKGDVIGMDGICNFHHASEAVVLSDCELISMPFNRLSAFGSDHPTIKRTILNALGQELARKRRDIRMITCSGAAARVAHFLLAMADCFAATGYSRKQFILRMTREDIGNYLGLSLETVSREMCSFHKLGLITVESRLVTINDASALAAFQLRPLRQRN